MYFVRDLYGVDWHGQICECEDVEHVEVPATTLSLTPQQLTELQSSIDPLEQCADFGVSVYVAARPFIHASSETK